MKTIKVKIFHLYLILLIAGFLGVSLLPQIIGIKNESYSVLFRALILTLSIFVALSTLFSNNFKPFSFRPYFLFLIFWTIYGLRIFHDLYYEPIALYPEKSASEYAQFAYGVVFIPAFTLIFLFSEKISLNLVLKWIYRIIFCSIILAIVFRSMTGAEGRSLGGMEIGILFFGQYGASLSILSLFLLLKSNTSNTHIRTIFHLIGFLLGFIGIFISASKSPFLALILVTMLFLIFKYGNVKAIILMGLFGTILYFYFFDFLLLMNSYFKSDFLNRLLYTIEVGEDASRIDLLKAGWSDFIKQPILGNAMLIQKNDFIGSYPHNLFVEAFMAIGFFGGLIFFFWSLKCILAARKIIKKMPEHSWVGLLFLQYFIFGMFSGNLYSNDLFWIFSILTIIVLSDNRFNRNKGVINLVSS